MNPEGFKTQPHYSQSVVGTSAGGAFSGLNARPKAQVKKQSRPKPQPIIAPADIFSSVLQARNESDHEDGDESNFNHLQRRDSQDSGSPQEVRFYVADPLVEDAPEEPIKRSS